MHVLIILDIFEFVCDICFGTSGYYVSARVLVSACL